MWESGAVTLIGATTENPSFEVNSALLSRCRVYTLKPLTSDDLGVILDRAIASEKGLKDLKVTLKDDARALLIRSCSGDARSVLNVLELAAINAPVMRKKRTVDADAIGEALQKQSLLYDKDGEEHFNIISALHKSLRGSDAQGRAVLARTHVGSG